MKPHATKASLTCWGSLIFGTVLRLKRFLENIERIMQQFVRQQILFTFKLLYLGDLPEEITGKDRFLLKIQHWRLICV